MKSLHALFGVALALNSEEVLAGPFGINMGDPIEKYEVAEQGFKPMLSTVPKPHPMFDTYSLWYSPSFGVCRVVAFSEFNKNDRYGDQTRQDFKKIKDALSAKYGAGREIEYMQQGAIWTEANEWVMSIRQNERTYAHDWPDVMDGAEKYKLIQLWVVAVSSDSSAIVLEYQSEKIDACSAEIDAGENGSL